MRTISPTNRLSRRAFVRGLGIGGALVAAPELWVPPAVAGTGDPEQLHVQFGGDASREVVVSWATPVQVRRPRLRLGLADGRSGAPFRPTRARTSTQKAARRSLPIMLVCMTWSRIPATATRSS